MRSESWYGLAEFNDRHDEERRPSSSSGATLKSVNASCVVLYAGVYLLYVEFRIYRLEKRYPLSESMVPGGFPN